MDTTVGSLDFPRCGFLQTSSSWSFYNPSIKELMFMLWSVLIWISLILFHLRMFTEGSCITAATQEVRLLDRVEANLWTFQLEHQHLAYYKRFTKSSCRRRKMLLRRTRRRDSLVWFRRYVINLEWFNAPAWANFH